MNRSRRHHDASFSAVDDGLAFAVTTSRWGIPSTRRLVLTSVGLSGDGIPSGYLPWSSFSASSAGVPSRTNRWGVVPQGREAAVVLWGRPPAPEPVEVLRRWAFVPSRSTVPPQVFTFAALCRFCATSPSAQLALGIPEQVQALVVALSGDAATPAVTVRSRADGEIWAAEWAVGSQSPLVGGRLFACEPVPDAERCVDLAVSHLGRPAARAAVADAVEEVLSRAPWPFDVLVRIGDG